MNKNRTLKQKCIGSVPYRIEQLKLGDGTCSEVRLGTNTQTGDQVAIKMVKKQDLLEEDLDNVRLEIDVLFRLDHPHIVKLLEAPEDAECLYLVMERQKCDLLEYLMQHGKFDEGDARRIFIQILDAVRYCHANKIVHRDLKLENVLLGEGMSVKLIDFGMCATNNEPNKLFVAYCGSMAYAAPEIVRERPYNGVAADVWSLGIILYSLLCGGMPFDDERQIVEGPLKFPRHVSKQPMDLVHRMLNKCYKKRPSIAELYQHPWILEVVDPCAFKALLC